MRLIDVLHHGFFEKSLVQIFFSNPIFCSFLVLSWSNSWIRFLFLSPFWISLCYLRSLLSDEGLRTTLSVISFSLVCLFDWNLIWLLCFSLPDIFRTFSEFVLERIDFRQGIDFRDTQQMPSLKFQKICISLRNVIFSLSRSEFSRALLEISSIETSRPFNSSEIAFFTMFLSPNEISFVNFDGYLFLVNSEKSLYFRPFREIAISQISTISKTQCPNCFQLKEHFISTCSICNKNVCLGCWMVDSSSEKCYYRCSDS
jgi:hypothetical protein